MIGVRARTLSLVVDPGPVVDVTTLPHKLAPAVLLAALPLARVVILL